MRTKTQILIKVLIQPKPATPVHSLKFDQIINGRNVCVCSFARVCGDLRHLQAASVSDQQTKSSHEDRDEEQISFSETRAQRSFSILSMLNSFSIMHKLFYNVGLYKRWTYYRLFIRVSLLQVQATFLILLIYAVNVYIVIYYTGPLIFKFNNYVQRRFFVASHLRFYIVSNQLILNINVVETKFVHVIVELSSSKWNNIEINCE